MGVAALFKVALKGNQKENQHLLGPPMYFEPNHIYFVAGRSRPVLRHSSQLPLSSSIKQGMKPL